jgi:hypothetical protein
MLGGEVFPGRQHAWQKDYRRCEHLGLKGRAFTRDYTDELSWRMTFDFHFLLFDRRSRL